MSESETRNQGWGGFAERVNEAYGLLLLLVVASYAVDSLTRYEGWGAVLSASVFGAAGAVAFGSSGARPARVREAASIGHASLLLAAVAALGAGDAFLTVAGILQTLLLVAAVFVVLRDVLTAIAVNFRTILGAVSVYMIFGLLFSSLYVTIDRSQAGPFFAEGGTGTGDFLFFSFTTLTTTGYGNLVPAAQPGMMVAGLEMLLGQIFLVTLIAGLVSLWRPRRRD